MVIVNSLLAASGVTAYLRYRRDQRKTQESLLLVEPTDPTQLQKAEESAKHYANVSTVSLGLVAASGIAGAPVLAFLGVPLNIYTNIPLLQESIATLAGKAEKRGSIFLSALLMGTIVTINPATTAIIDWLAQRSRLSRARLDRWGEDTGTKAQSWVEQVLGGKPDNVWVVKNGDDVSIPYADLQVDQLVRFERNDFVPLTGVVQEGTAELINWSAPTNPSISVSEGDYVYSRMMLLKGSIVVRVESLD